ncbi:YheC/YheD family protein [Clostridium thermosuccinogenes]|uniref:YheC/YheD family endospore coat-associated protein n=1 Tax=Clostridium thermosuccinogenes TaxID=84032 RepID=UPI001379645E|nr:YheC/YheD family protein [Pseudoclostridium thermosuccinogenes]
MWAKIEVVPSDREIIYLPESLSTEADSSRSIEVKFGGKTATAKILYTDDLKLEKGSFENPGKIRLSNKLKDKLLIPESLVYRIVITDTCISIGPVIGLLLGVHTHRYNPRHMKKYSDRLGIYNKVGGLIYAFSPKSVNWNRNSAYGLYYNIATASWEYGCFPLPDVIYRRDFHSSPKHIDKLMDFTGGRLFNSYRFSKYQMYEVIKENNELSKYLPSTDLSLNFEQVKKFIDSHSKVILKPIDLSRGRGICIIEKIDDAYKVTDYRYKNPVVSVLHDNESLREFFANNPNLFNRYLIQKYLSLARIGNSLFDIRVVMQKRPDHTWGCTGIECRVSNSNSHLTNISRGGYALTLEEALYRAFAEDCEPLSQEINEFCQKFCSYMDEMGEHFAEFGMDIAVDTEKNIWLIEANVFPSFKGFKIMDRQTYLSIRYTPLLYALSLTEFGDGL